MGSASTDVRGLVGRPLAAGDVLGTAREVASPMRMSARVDWPVDGATVRILPGPQASRGGARAARRCRSAHRGGRSHGRPPRGRRDPRRRVVSEPPPLGAIQITPNGDPFVLLVDRYRTGGYCACPAVVHPDDLPIIAQLLPGMRVTFTLVERACDGISRSSATARGRAASFRRPRGRCRRTGADESRSRSSTIPTTALSVENCPTTTAATLTGPRVAAYDVGDEGGRVERAEGQQARADRAARKRQARARATMRAEQDERAEAAGRDRAHGPEILGRGVEREHAAEADARSPAAGSAPAAVRRLPCGGGEAASDERDREPDADQRADVARRRRSRAIAAMPPSRPDDRAPRPRDRPCSSARKKSTKPSDLEHAGERRRSRAAADRHRRGRRRPRARAGSSAAPFAISSTSDATYGSVRFVIGTIQ